MEETSRTTSRFVFVDESGYGHQPTGKERYCFYAAVSLRQKDYPKYVQAFQNLVTNYFRDPRQPLKGRKAIKQIHRGKHEHFCIDLMQLLMDYKAYIWICGTRYGSPRILNAPASKPAAVGKARRMLCERITGNYRGSPPEPRLDMVIWDVLERPTMENFSRENREFVNGFTGKRWPQSLSRGLLGGDDDDWRGLQTGDFLANHALNFQAKCDGIQGANQDKAEAFRHYFLDLLMRNQQSRTPRGIGYTFWPKEENPL